jgi:hypothetical protein
MQGFTTIPFKSESEHGLTKVDGVAKFSSAGVVLEFESKLFGLIGGGVKEVRLPVARHTGCEFPKRSLQTRSEDRHPDEEFRETCRITE